MSKNIVNDLLRAARINPKSFEAELGLLCHKWIMLNGLDRVIEAVDAELIALEGHRDLTIDRLPKK